MSTSMSSCAMALRRGVALRAAPAQRIPAARSIPRIGLASGGRRFASTSSAPPLGAGGSTTRRALPKVPNPYPLILFTVVFAAVSWSGFTLVSNNQERTSSSIFKDVVYKVKMSPRVHSLMFAPHPGVGETGVEPSTKAVKSSSQSPIVLKHEWWLGGAPYVRGIAGMMKGRIDLSFKITTLPIANGGTSTTPRTATVYFTSIRADKSAAFEIIRFLVVQDDPPHDSVSLLDAPSVPIDMLLT